MIALVLIFSFKNSANVLRVCFVRLLEHSFVQTPKCSFIVQMQPLFFRIENYNFLYCRQNMSKKSIPPLVHGKSAFIFERALLK